jgi:hypothetical protein
MTRHDEDRMRIPDCRPTTLRESRDRAATGRRSLDRRRRGGRRRRAKFDNLKGNNGRVTVIP